MGAPEVEDAAAGGCSALLGFLTRCSLAVDFGRRIKFGAWLLRTLGSFTSRLKIGYPLPPPHLWNLRVSRKFPAKYGCQRA